MLQMLCNSATRSVFEALLCDGEPTRRRWNIVDEGKLVHRAPLAVR